MADDALKIAQTYGIDLPKLEKGNVITKDEKVHRVCHLYETEMNYPADDVDKNSLHQQLCYLSYLIDLGETEKIRFLLGKENFREPHLKQMVFLLLKSFGLRRNKGETLSSEESKEVDILTILADVMGIREEKGLDPYF